MSIIIFFKYYDIFKNSWQILGGHGHFIQIKKMYKHKR